MGTIRVRDDQEVVSVFCHELLSSVILSPGTAFDSNHPIVKQAPWAFDGIEDASASPGRKRSVKRVESNDDD